MNAVLLGAAMTEVRCNLFIPHVVDESNRLVTEPLVDRSALQSSIARIIILNS